MIFQSLEVEISKSKHIRYHRRQICIGFCSCTFCIRVTVCSKFHERFCSKHFFRSARVLAKKCFSNSITPWKEVSLSWKFYVIRNSMNSEIYQKIRCEKPFETGFFNVKTHFRLLEFSRDVFIFFSQKLSDHITRCLCFDKMKISLSF